MGVHRCCAAGAGRYSFVVVVGAGDAAVVVSVFPESPDPLSLFFASDFSPVLSFVEGPVSLPVFPFCA
jgi:hypothetical protein